MNIPHLLVMSEDIAIFHDKYDILKRRDILQWVTAHRNDIG